MAKIIGTTETSLLVEMTVGEISQIMGPGYAHLVRGDNRKAFDVGVEIPISKMWQRLDRLSVLQQTLDGVAQKMRESADWLVTIPAILEPPQKKPAKKDS